MKKINMKSNSNIFTKVGNNLVHTRLFDAPRELVWEAWTNPDI